REFVDVQVPAPFALGLEPRLVARGDEPARVSLRLRRPDREVVRVLVLSVAGVSADPAPVDLVPAGRRDELPREFDVPDLAVLPASAPPDPGMDPLAHPPDQVLRVRGEDDAARCSQRAQPLDRAPDRHAVVRRGGLADPVIAAFPPALAPVFDQARGAPGRVPVGELDAETGLVGIDIDEWLHEAVEGRAWGAFAQPSPRPVA